MSVLSQTSPVASFTLCANNWATRCVVYVNDLSPAPTLVSKTFFSYRRCGFILWTAPRRGVVSPVIGQQPLVWNNFNPIGPFALFYSMETTTQMSTNLASWLRRNCCPSEWVTAKLANDQSPEKMFTYPSCVYRLIWQQVLFFVHAFMDVCISGD